MAHHDATVRWSRGTQPYVDRKYRRTYEVAFDGGHVLPGAASPDVVPAALTDAAGTDPEELFVASLSSCHMLWFLDFAARAGHVVDHYEDHATGTLARDADGREAMTVVTLRPVVTFGANAPDAAAHAALHDRAHHACFIANSVRSEVRLEPRLG